jgi:hypothetical protein
MFSKLLNAVPAGNPGGWPPSRAISANEPDVAIHKPTILPLGLVLMPSIAKNTI